MASLAGRFDSEDDRAIPLVGVRDDRDKARTDGQEAERHAGVSNERQTTTEKTKRMTGVYMTPKTQDAPLGAC